MNGPPGYVSDNIGLQLTNDLWELVFRHLDNPQDQGKAAGTCKASWAAGLTKVAIPEQFPTDGAFQCSHGVVVL